MQTQGVWPGPPAEPWAPASSLSWGKRAWGVGRRIHKYRKPWGADPPQAKVCLTGWPQERALLGDEEICPQPALFLSPTPHHPHPRPEPQPETEGVALSSLASIRIGNDASREETCLLGPPLTKRYLLGERDLGYFNYSTYAQGILRSIYRLLLTICILRLLLRQNFCFKMNV